MSGTRVCRPAAAVTGLRSRHATVSLTDIRDSQTRCRRRHATSALWRQAVAWPAHRPCSRCDAPMTHTPHTHSERLCRSARKCLAARSASCSTQLLITNASGQLLVLAATILGLHVWKGAPGDGRAPQGGRSLGRSAARWLGCRLRGNSPSIIYAISPHHPSPPLPHTPYSPLESAALAASSATAIAMSEAGAQQG